MDSNKFMIFNEKQCGNCRYEEEHCPVVLALFEYGGQSIYADYIETLVSEDGECKMLQMKNKTRYLKGQLKKEFKDV